MIVKIQPLASNIINALRYNENKSEAKEGCLSPDEELEYLKSNSTGHILATFNVPEPSTLQNEFARLKMLNERNARGRKLLNPTLHISVNPGERDRKLSEAEVVDFIVEVMDKLGNGETPYRIYRHDDNGRTHYHIVGIRIGQDGKKIRVPILWRLWLRKRAAARRMPEVDKLMKREFKRLSDLEKSNSTSIDEVADCTAVVMRDMTRALVKTDDVVDLFTYNLGRLIYLLDAVDDAAEDSKKGRYNVIVNNYGKCTEKADYLLKNADELSFLLKSTYNRMVESYNQMKITIGEGVLSNTIYLGLNLQIERLLKGVEKCQTIRL